MEDPSGWIWSLMTVIGVIILGVALAYAIVLWRHRSRSPSVKEAQAERTHELYDRDPHQQLGEPTGRPSRRR